MWWGGAGAGWCGEDGGGRHHHWHSCGDWGGEVVESKQRGWWQWASPLFVGGLRWCQQNGEGEHLPFVMMVPVFFFFLNINQTIVHLGNILPNITLHWQHIHVRRHTPAVVHERSWLLATCPCASLTQWHRLRGHTLPHMHYVPKGNYKTNVSQSVDLGRSNNPNTTPTKDYENVRVVVYLRGVQRGCAEEGERGSTPTGWCRQRCRILLGYRSNRRRRGQVSGLFL